jgi:hypothetical protein
MDVEYGQRTKSGDYQTSPQLKRWATRDLSYFISTAVYNSTTTETVKTRKCVAKINKKPIYFKPQVNPLIPDFLHQGNQKKT